MGIIWNSDYKHLYTSLVMASGKYAENMDKAYKIAKNRFGGDAMDYVVIKVEGYECIAKVLNRFNQIEITREVIPFNREKVYPLQAIKIEARFWTYEECMKGI